MKHTFILLILSLIPLLASCGQRDQRRAVAVKLQEKYGEEFTVVDARYSVMTQTYNFKAYPKNDRSMEISGIYNADLSYFSDSYTSQLISKDYRSYLQKDWKKRIITGTATV